MNAIGIVSCLGLVGVLVGSGLLARWLDGRRSGWTGLAHRYPAGPPTAGPSFPAASVRLNGQWYRGSADVRLTGGGIRVGRPPVFRPFHRPMLLPWDDVAIADVTGDGELPLTVGESTTVTLTGPAAERASRVLRRRAVPRAVRFGR